MQPRVQEKQQALLLRKRGYSYNEILAEITVAKSSLSLWLKDTPLSNEEKRLLKERKDANLTRGRLKAAAAHRANREQRDAVLFEEAKSKYELFKNDPLFTLGIALYWAEGAKRSFAFMFTNSDSDMMNIMLDWVERFFSVSRPEIKVRLYIHKPYAHERCEEQWSKRISVPLHRFQKTVYKPTGLLIKKRPDYIGCLRIEIAKARYLRLMKFWLQMFLAEYQKNSRVNERL